MYQTINKHDFEQAFRSANRGDQFSYEALGLIFDYLEEIDEDYELDVIAICCDFAEGTTLEIAQDYKIDLTDSEGEPLSEDEQIDAVRDYLDHRTSIVGETSGGFVYANF